MSSTIKIRPKIVTRSVVQPTRAKSPEAEATQESDRDPQRTPSPEFPPEREDNERTQDGGASTPDRHPYDAFEDSKDLAQHLYNPLETQRFKNKSKVWPPPDGPNDDRCYVVEGMGGQHHSQRDGEEDDVDGPQEAPRTEIVQDHVEPVSKLKKKFLGKPKRPIPGVNKPQIQVKEPETWIKHVKLPPEYDNDPKELPWMQLVRNRRWNSTVKARFPCKKDDVTNFERRSTTPKNWKNLLKDKHTTKLLSEIAGVEGAGEELLYRLAEQRQRESTEEEPILDRPMTEDEILAYQYVRDNLESALLSAEEEHGRQSSSESSNQGQRESEYAFLRQLKKPLRLHPEQFKKLLSLERSREATLRWQFSSDPYDSVHEHQYLPFEIAMATADNDRIIHQALKKLLQSYDYDHAEIFGTPPPTDRNHNRMLTPTSQLGSEKERRLSIGSGSSQQDRSRAQYPQVVPRRSRSVSPSVRCVTEMNGAEDESQEMHQRDQDQIEENILKKELQKLQNEISRKEPISDMAPTTSTNQKNAIGETSSSEEEHNLPVEQRMKKFLDGVNKSERLIKKSSVDQDEIDISEVASRRKQFLNQERQSSLEKNDNQKPRRARKVQRRRSDAELHEMLSRRRQKADADSEEQTEPEKSDMMTEMTNLINDIQQTFSGSSQPVMEKDEEL